MFRSVPILTSSLALVLLLFAPSIPQAALVGGPDIIPAPSSVIDDPPGATNTAQQAFDERQNVLLAAPLFIDDGGMIPAGTTVSSHMIFLNSVGTTLISDPDVIWTFDAPILGVMSNTSGSLEVASTPILGSPVTNYPAAPFSARGLEDNDSYTVAGNQITVSMSVTEPGDWIRVVTEGRLAHFDIKPTSCPNPLNPRSKGVIPAAILGTAGFDVSQVDAASLLLEGVSPKRWNYEDVAEPFTGDLCGCSEEGPDGFVDMTLKFSTQEIVAAIGAGLSGDEVVLTLTGVLLNGTPFVTQDCMILRGDFESLGTIGGGDGGIYPAADEPGEDKLTWGRIKATYGDQE